MCYNDKMKKSIATPRNYAVTDANLDEFDFTARELMRVAIDRGWKIEYSEAMPDNSMSGIAHCKKNGRELIFRTDHTALTPIYAYAASENKNLSAALFEKNHVPTPLSITIPTNISDDELKVVLCDFNSLVVKPLNTNHGKGITIGVKGTANTREAIEFAKKATLSKRFVILQEQVTNAKEYRFLVLNGKVIAVAHRRPPFVTGDGVSTVDTLIDVLNSDPRRSTGHKAVLTQIRKTDVINENGEDFLKVVPAIGVCIDILKTSNLSRGGVAEDFTDTASNTLKQIAVLAAKSCFLGLAGVDIMTSDIANGSRSNSYVIEVNSAPGLRMHEYPSIGTPRNVIGLIFDVLEERASPIED